MAIMMMVNSDGRADSKNACRNCKTCTKFKKLSVQIDKDVGNGITASENF